MPEVFDFQVSNVPDGARFHSYLSLQEPIISSRHFLRRSKDAINAAERELQSLQSGHAQSLSLIWDLNKLSIPPSGCVDVTC